MARFLLISLITLLIFSCNKKESIYEPSARVDPYKIYDEVTFRHPVYDLPALEAQKDLAEKNGQRNTWFCGAWMKNGFHEDGLASALDVVDKFSDRISVKIAAQ